MESKRVCSWLKCFYHSTPRLKRVFVINNIYCLFTILVGRDTTTVARLLGCCRHPGCSSQPPGCVSQSPSWACILLMQLDQSCIDRGSWTLSAELALEGPPPMATLAQHVSPDISNGEQPFSRLLDPRWSEVCMPWPFVPSYRDQVALQRAFQSPYTQHIKDGHF